VSLVSEIRHIRLRRPLSLHRQPQVISPSFTNFFARCVSVETDILILLKAIRWLYRTADIFNFMNSQGKALLDIVVHLIYPYKSSLMRSVDSR
jgi:hypothetical protein